MSGAHASSEVSDFLSTEPHLGYALPSVIKAIGDLHRVDASFRVLDAGCGFGHASCAIAQQFPGSRIVGVDTERSVLELSRRRAMKSGLGQRVEFQDGHLVVDDPPDERFDLLLFLAAQQVFREPNEIQNWLNAYGVEDAAVLLDRAVVVFPGMEPSEEVEEARFRSALGRRATRVSSRVEDLSPEGSLACVDIVLEHLNDETRLQSFVAIRNRIRQGSRARASSALYLVQKA